MTREDAKKLLPIITAISEGKAIQYLSSDGWKDIGSLISHPSLLSNPEKYRIKPTPTYRPFKDAEECWNEMLKHQPFGWVKAIKINNYQLFTSISNDENHLRNVFEAFTFADGSVFGIKCEED